jgi:hypothetical protein
MSDMLLKIHTSALDGLGDNPRPFGKWAALAAEDDYPDADLSEAEFCVQLAEDKDRGGALTALWARVLTAWDFAESPPWSPDTTARTAQRRIAVYHRLRIGDAMREALDVAVPVAEVPGATVIAREHTPWYTSERAKARSFYWQAYERTLRRKGWSETAIASLSFFSVAAPG